MSEEEHKIFSLMPWDITVRNATQRKSARALLERDDADEIIRGMSELEIYYALRALGVDDSVPFLSVIEGEQITTLFDLEVWHHERPNWADLFTWLDGFREAGLSKLQAAVRTLDVELLAAALRARLLIAPKPTDDDPDYEMPEWLNAPSDDILPVIETPDQTWLIAARAEDELTGESFDEEERKTVLRFIEDLYRDEDFAFVSRLLQVACSDLSSELEESSLRFRNARLEDLGFPPRERALEVYGPLDVDQVLATQEGARKSVEMKLPAVLIEPYARGFLEEVLGTLEDPELVRELESELVSVSNAALVADGVEPGDLEGIRGVLERARGYIELALLHRAVPGTELELGRKRLKEHSIRTLFRAGYSQTLQVSRRARALLPDPALGPARRFVEDRDRLLLIAIQHGTRPLFVSETPEATEPEPFRHPDQLESAHRRLLELETLAKISAAVQFADAHARATAEVLPPPEEWTFEHLLATLLARGLLGAPGAPFEPIEARALAELTRLWPAPEAAVAALERALRGAVPSAELTRLDLRLRSVLARLIENVRVPIDHRFTDPLIRRA